MSKDTIQNPLLCDPETGVCEIPGQQANENKTEVVPGKKAVKLIYFTDPICSSCWGIEPQLRKMKLEYGKDIEIEYHMGGLLPDWSYNSGGISKPSDVAHHWDEVSLHYKMPIDGDVWLEDPLHSSYPPSVAFKAAEMQDKGKAVAFLRNMREMVFLRKQNITRWEIIEKAAAKADLNVSVLKNDMERARQAFEEDLAMAKKMGVRGFPTIFVANGTDNQITVYGTKPYEAYEQAIAKVLPEVKKSAYATGWENLFGKYETLTTREFAELKGIEFGQAEELLLVLTKENKLERFITKNGSLWIRK